MQDKILKTFPAKIANMDGLIKGYEHDIQLRDKNNSENFTMKLGKNIYTERKDAGALILKALHNGKYADKEIGIFKGFTIIPQAKDNFMDNPKIVLKGAISHTIELSASDVGSIQKMENYLDNLNFRLTEAQESLTNTYQQLELTQTQVNKPFEHVEELSTVMGELNEVNSELDIGREDNSSLLDENQNSDESNLAEEFIEVIDEEIEHAYEL